MKKLVVECWDYLGEKELREMSLREFKNKCKGGRWPIYSSGMYFDEEKKYIVLMINGKLNKSLLSYASHSTCQKLISEYHVNEEIIHDIIIEHVENLECYYL